MPSRLVLTPRAAEDLDRQADFIAQDNPPAAQRYLRAAFDAFDQIAVYPLMGVAKALGDESLAGLRQWRVPGFENYLIFYLQREETLRIVRVLHGAQDLELLLRADASDEEAHGSE